jgi:hypothetical protein
MTIKPSIASYAHRETNPKFETRNLTSFPDARSGQAAVPFIMNIGSAMPDIPKSSTRPYQEKTKTWPSPGSDFVHEWAPRKR